jgi:hypothetical protein
MRYSLLELVSRRLGAEFQRMSQRKGVWHRADGRAKAHVGGVVVRSQDVLPAGADEVLTIVLEQRKVCLDIAKRSWFVFRSMVRAPDSG